MGPDGFFLSAENPVATTDQRDMEALALRLLDHPALMRARATAEVLFRNAMAYPLRDQMDRFAGMLDEYVFYWALRAANSDPERPKVLRLMEPPIRRFGHDTPGSRWGGECPDFIYRMIPIRHGGAYRIFGQATCAEPPTVVYALMGNGAAPTTHGTIDSRDIPPDSDGGFTISVDASPAEGRPGHLQTQDGGDCHLLIRDALGDWLVQTPNRLKVARAGATARAAPGEDELAAHAARTLLEGLYFTYYSTQSGSGQPPNAIRPPQSSGAFGGLAAQAGAKGALDLAEDEALIVRLNTAGALFRNVQLCDRFFVSLNYWERTGGLNMAQMAPDEDGQCTVVVAHEDPGVHNWLDTGGLKRTLFGARWQMLPRNGSAEAPSLVARVVNLRALGRELPDGVRRIDAAGRAEQIAQRSAGFARRLLNA